MESVTNDILYEIKLQMKILDIAREGAIYTLESTQKELNAGYMPFVRKLANKLIEISKKNEEVANCLDSLPEWAEFVEGHLKKHNEIETKALGLKKQEPEKHEDFLDMMFQMQTSSANDKKDDEDSDSDDEQHDENLFSETKKSNELFADA